MNSSRAVKIKVNKLHVGDVIDSTFVKKIFGSRHLLRNPRAIAYSETALKEAELNGAEFLKVIDKDTHLIYSTTIEKFKKNGFDVNRGYGPQIAMVLEEWEVENQHKKKVSKVNKKRDVEDNKPLEQLNFRMFRNIR